jgi:hypothetical protein
MDDAARGPAALLVMELVRAELPAQNVKAAMCPTSPSRGPACGPERLGIIGDYSVSTDTAALSQSHDT